MKRLLFFFLLPITLIAQDPDDILFKTENDPPPFFPFTISGSYVGVGKTHFYTPGFKDKDLIFKQWEAAFSYKQPLSLCSGLLFGAGWVGNELNMQDNPEFRETIFSYVNFLIGGYTTAFNNWLWKLTFAAYLDTDEFSWVDYALYQGVIWGTYDLSKCFELDFGFIVEAGLNKTKVWPILGFIYTPSPKWEFCAVFPVDLSLNYSFTKCLMASASIRFLRTRHRVKDSEPNPQGIFEYRTTGVEFDLTYIPSLHFTMTGFVGSTTKGDLKIGNRMNRHATHYKFNGSLYAGASATASF